MNQTICERCGAKESFYFYKGRCRRCIGLQLSREIASKSVQIDKVEIGFELTEYQVDISNKLVECVMNNQHVYLEAVCGAGKTEMCYQLIKRIINEGKSICWAIPRREVVMELYERLHHVFASIKVIRVCEGFTEQLEGDLIICTTHQLFRYHQRFDVLIIDEPDAFPFHGNEMLENLAAASCKGVMVYLSATFEAPGDFKRLQLSHRPSGRLLPLPSYQNIAQVINSLLVWKDEMVLVFVPTKRLALMISLILRCPYITSSSKNKSEILERFRVKKGYLVCTTILERGVTFPDCYVIVLFAHHIVFNKASLVQISGRVERGLNPTKGEVVFWGKSMETKACLEYIHYHRSNV